jgi:tartrate dehydrogenase/decarboxylase/D-malate dehydrogenase
MGTYPIAIYAGDGIGLEVTAEATKVLRAVADVCGFGLRLTEVDWGHRHWQRHGTVVPSDYLSILRDFPAVFLGAVGDPANVPDHITLRPLIEMRQAFDQYICLRPARLFPGVRTPLADKTPSDIDLVVVRENSEGEYVDVGGVFKGKTDDGLALQTAIHTRKGVERVQRFALQLARQRARRHLTLVTKSNALRHGMVFWDDIFDLVRVDYPEVTCDKCHVDAMTMALVHTPERYDVIVGSNLFGDILSDLAGAIAGSIGLAPSANLNPERRFPSLFEPVHGSAPDLAGKGVANPIAAIRSVALLLDFLGERDAGTLLEEAVAANLGAGQVRTPDIGGRNTTRQVGDDIVRRLSGGTRPA